MGVICMKNKTAIRVASMTLAVVMAAMVGGQALAVEWHPSRTQEEVTVVESTTTTTSGVVINVNKAPTTNEDGSVPAPEQVVQVESSTEQIIQVTPVSMTLAANAALAAANPNATGEQLASMATGSGLSFAANGQLNNLYQQVTAAESTQQLLETMAPAAAASFAETVGEDANQYTPIGLYDVAMSPAAAAAVGENQSVSVAIAVPGVAEGTQLVAVCWDRNGNSRLVPVRVVNGVVYLSAATSGPVMIMSRVQAQG